MRTDSGGLQPLSLFWPNTVYNIKDMIDKIQPKFYNQYTKTTFDNSTIKIATLHGKDPHIIDKFCDEDDIECGLWIYFKNKKITPSRIRLYIVTIQKGHSDIHDSDTEDSHVQDSHTQDSHTQNSRIQDSNIHHPDLQDNDLEIISHSLVHPKLLSEKSLLKNRDTFIVLYHWFRKCHGTGNWRSVEISKRDLWMQLQSNDELIVSQLSFNMFDPVACDYPISKIERNGETLMEIIRSKDNTLKSVYNTKGKDSTQSCEILYGCRELRGMCDGQFGLGTPPMCDERCDPYFTWYRNEKIVKKGYLLFWILCDEGEHPWSHD